MFPDWFTVLRESRISFQPEGTQHMQQPSQRQNANAQVWPHNPYIAFSTQRNSLNQNDASSVEPMLVSSAYQTAPPMPSTPYRASQPGASEQSHTVRSTTDEQRPMGANNQQIHPITADRNPTVPQNNRQLSVNNQTADDPDKSRDLFPVSVLSSQDCVKNKCVSQPESNVSAKAASSRGRSSAKSSNVNALLNVIQNTARKPKRSQSVFTPRNSAQRERSVSKNRPGENRSAQLSTSHGQSVSKNSACVQTATSQDATTHCTQHSVGNQLTQSTPSQAQSVCEPETNN